MRISLLAIPCLVTVALLGCTRGPLSDEDVITEIIRRVAGAAEKKDIQTIKKALSRSYRDKEGNDYDAVNAYLLSQFFRAEKLGVTLTISQVTVESGKAKSHTEAVLTRVPKGAGVTGYIARDADYYRFDVDWLKESGDWKVISVSWGPMRKVP